MTAARWNENTSAAFAGMACTPTLGGLAGYAGSIGMYRHCPSFCKPGMWDVSLCVGAEAADFFSIKRASAAAVIDDFGNLVRVPS